MLALHTTWLLDYYFNSEITFWNTNLFHFLFSTDFLISIKICDTSVLITEEHVLYRCWAILLWCVYPCIYVRHLVLCSGNNVILCYFCFYSLPFHWTKKLMFSRTVPSRIAVIMVEPTPSLLLSFSLSVPVQCDRLISWLLQLIIADLYIIVWKMRLLLTGHSLHIWGSKVSDTLFSIRSLLQQQHPAMIDPCHVVL